MNHFFYIFSNVTWFPLITSRFNILLVTLLQNREAESLQSWIACLGKFIQLDSQPKFQPLQCPDLQMFLQENSLTAIDY